jgi:hypothetical protein
MAGLTRNGPRLLKQVGNKPHASEDDHEEEPAPPSKRRKTDALPVKKEQTEEEINAEPQSSDEELHAPPPRAAKPSIRAISRRNSTEDLALKKPQRTSSRKIPPIRAPARGAYQNGQVHKGREVEDKENAPTSSAESGPIAWGMEYEAQKNSKKPKTTFASKRTINIHATAPKKNGGAAKTYGGRDKLPQPSTGNGSDLSKAMSDDELDDMLKDIDPDLPSRPQPKPKRSGTEATKSKPALLDDDELSDTLGTYSKDPLARTEKKTSKSADTLNKLNKWKEDQEPPSSQTQSSAPQEDLDDVSNYVNALPDIEEEGSRCTLCSKSVEPDDYWDFWKGKKKTVKNKTAFCHAHQKISAQKEYTNAGYPTIDWSALPRRLRRHKAVLSHILNNTNMQPSIHRDRYEPLALTGKAAAVPSRRPDLSKDQQDELDSYALDDTAAYPGYYGPHGRRVITENVMEILKTELKHCTDAVVQASGIAAFVQAVMVPEAAVLLIMEDCELGWEEAESVREKTYEMGVLLNEEIEDEVERRPEDDSDAENEYRK